MSPSAFECPVCGSCGSLEDDAFCRDCGHERAKSRRFQDTFVGREVPGGYRIVDVVGEGAMGKVYRADHKDLGRTVAIKVMSQSLVGQTGMVERFKQEARAAGSLNHPNCVRVYDSGQTAEGVPYFVMELLEGVDLQTLLQQTPLLPLSRVLDLSLQILAGLEEAHSFGVVHRDLKPANIFILPQRGGGDLLKVLDFGLAKVCGVHSVVSGMVFGTPAYISPEQAMLRATDARTDLYALGVMLFEMLAGERPFDSNNPQTLMELHVYTPAPNIGAIVSERTMFGLADIVDRALQKKPLDRFQSAADFASALRRVAAFRCTVPEMEAQPSVARAYHVCAECGGLNPVGPRFCGECGGPISRAAASEMQETAYSGSPVSPSSSDEVASSSATSREQAGETVPHNDLDRDRYQLRMAIAQAETADDPASTLLLLEQAADQRMMAQDPVGAVLVLQRAVCLARAHLDQGELDDPVHIMALFSTKLGEALLEAGDFALAQATAREALTLSTSGQNRARVWLLLARLARTQHQEHEAAEYLAAAERETKSDRRRRN